MMIGTAAPASILRVIATTEADHFGDCPVCGAHLDVRDLGQVLAHIHDVEIEIGEGAGPPERGDPVCAKELAGPALAVLWRFLPCVRLSCGAQHFFPLLCALVSCGPQHFLLFFRLCA
jgi:hypothetical protein